MSQHKKGWCPTNRTSHSCQYSIFSALYVCLEPQEMQLEILYLLASWPSIDHSSRWPDGSQPASTHATCHLGHKGKSKLAWQLQALWTGGAYLYFWMFVNLKSHDISRYPRPRIVLGRQGPQRCSKSSKFSPWQRHRFSGWVHLKGWKGEVSRILIWLHHSLPSGGSSNFPFSRMWHSHVPG